MIIAIGLATTLIVILCLPFFLTKGGQLQESASLNSIEQLDSIKQSLLKRYLEDEKAHNDKLISDSVWHKRKLFLTSRYLDATRRQDFLNYLKGLEKDAS